MESNENLPNLSDICRTCLTCSENMTSLLGANEETVLLIKKLSTISNLEVIISSVYPNNICLSCQNKINLFYEFQQLCRRSNEAINGYLESKNEANDGSMSPDKNTIVEPFFDKQHSQSVQTEDFGYDSNKNTLSEDDDTFQGSREHNDNGEVHYSRQGIKLKQFDPKEVETVIREARAKFYRPIRCVICNFQTGNSRALSVHMTRIHSDVKKSWCLSCNEFYSDLEEHNKQQHSDDLKCPFCQKSKLNMGHFVEHVTGHSGDKQHKCLICKKSFPSVRKLRLHKETHAESFSCAKCLKRFGSRRSLQLHSKNGKNCQEVKEETELDQEKLAQLEPQNFCKDCNKKVRSLKKHVKAFHVKEEVKDEKKYLCPFCGKQFKAFAKLTVHMRVHTGETPYKCKYCDKRSRTRTVMISHERTHTGEKPYVCNDCGKRFSQSSILNTHRKIHTGRPEVCTICNQRFCRPSELKIHMRKHTGEKPYQCKQCDQCFKQKSHLIDHGKVHNSERPYQCEFCEKTFRHISSLKAHIQIHLDQKPYKCTQCPYACRQSFSLTQHMKQHGTSGGQVENNTRHVCNVCHRNCKTASHFIAHYNRYHGEIRAEDVTKASESITLYSGDAMASEEITDVNPIVNVEDVSYVENVILKEATDCVETMPIKDNIDIIYNM